MKIEIVKYHNDECEPRWKITKDDAYICMYLSEDEAIKSFDKLVRRLREPKQDEIVIKSIEI